MNWRAAILCSVSAVGMLAATATQAADAPSAITAAAAVADQAPPPAADDSTVEELVVTGIRSSLERAAEIKQNAVQVVDSIVAQDIGKLPDPTTAAALQRVPGIQVSVNRNNELGDVRVRGLPDILTTVNGREVFSTTGRNFDLQDMPAEALARIDVFKSQTPDLIEGGLAGVIDLKLNRPFSFNKPTVVLSARGNSGKRVDKLNPQFGALLTNTWETPVGDVGVLVNGTWSKSDYYRAQTILRERRSMLTTPFNTPGLMVPTILQNFPEEGVVKRRQLNAAIQWQVSPALEVYAEGFYTYFRDRGGHNGANAQPFTSGVTASNIVPSDNCILTRVGANGTNPTIVTNAAGVQSLTAHTVQTLCDVASVTFNNLVINQTQQARDQNAENTQFSAGLNYEQDGWTANLDVSYQTSESDRTLIIADIGQRLTSLTYVADVGGVGQYTVPGDQLLSADNLYIRNSFQQQFGLTKGELFAVKADAEREIGGIVSSVKFGVRYADRSADSFQTNLNTPIPGGNIGTPSESRAVKVSATGLPAEFLELSSVAPSLNGGSRFYVPSVDFLLSESGLDAMRTYFRLPTGRPGFQPNRQFNASEKTIAGYAEIKYEAPLGDIATVDGVVGARVAQTERTIGTFAASGATFEPIGAKTTDRDVLPSATARFKFDNGIQARLGYAKYLRRPNFDSLNPAVTLQLSNNPLVQSAGNAGNPDLKPQKSDSYDATLEYYFDGGYIAAAGYYRNITNRVITGRQVETIDGVDYAISRPRNVGEASLKGVEISGQYFLDFLPGALSGVGVQGAFTYADSEIKGDDPLAGNPLQGVSKYNYTTGLLYEKHGISARLVYTYRSKYFDSDETGTPTLRPVDPDRVGEVYVPTLLSNTRAAGRLDFNIGYDVTEAIRIDVGGTNILKSKHKKYYGWDRSTDINHEANFDETTYTVGVRARF